MRIAFDIDGVIVDIDLGLIRAIDFFPEGSEARKQASRFYYLMRRRQLNPIDYLSEDDELFFITGRNEAYRDLTEKWASKYFPQATLVILGHEEPKAGEPVLKKWYVRQAERKAKALKKYKIDVYFEDTPPVVRELRKMCPETKIIQYGGRFDE